ncbi:uncharacterized protein METZ01_LOCUS64416, partial [marine metagenome]
IQDPRHASRRCSTLWRSKDGRSMESFCRPCFKSLPFRTLGCPN